MLRPPRSRKTDAPPHATRLLLADTAARLIAERGLDAVDIDAILSEAGVTKGALYHHYENVNDLIVTALLQLYTREVDGMITAFHTVLADSASSSELRERLAMVTRATQDPTRAPFRLQRARVFSLSPTYPALAAQLATEQQRLTDAIAQTVREAQARKWIRPELDPNAVAVFIQAYTLGRIVDDISEAHIDGGSWTALIDHVVDAFLLD